MNINKLLWLDTETTGVNPGCAVVQIAGIIEVAGNVVDEFNITARPHKGAEITPEALKVIGKTIEQLFEYQQPAAALREFEKHLGAHCDKFNSSDKFVLCGHNCGFDFTRLAEFYETCDNKYLGSWMHYKWKFDTLAVIQALQICGKLPMIENNKLTTIAAALGIELESAHDALSDIRATRLIGTRLINLLKGD